MPLVSVLMTAYNREKYIAEAIESVLASSYQNWELIIVDDGSTDSTVNIARGFEAKDRRIKVYVNEKNLGDYPNRNKAASYAKGTYLQYLDSDDYFFPDSITYCVYMMETNPEAEWGIFNVAKIENETLLHPQESLAIHFFQIQFLIIGPGGTILKRTFFESLGMYPVKYGPANDMYFNLKAASAGNLLLLNKDFLFYRIHEGQEKNNNSSYLFNNYNYMRDALDEIQMAMPDSHVRWLQKKNKRRFTVNMAKYFFSTFSLRRSAIAIKKAEFTFKDLMEGVFQ